MSDDATPAVENLNLNGEKAPESHSPPRDSKGWDGKLRIEKEVVLSNPEAISDPEYSDEENVHPGDQIDADEGRYLPRIVLQN